MFSKRIWLSAPSTETASFFQMTISLSAPGNTLTATTNVNVGPTPWAIIIYDSTTNTRVCFAGSGTTCTATGSAPDSYYAVIANGAGANIQDVSNYLYYLTMNGNGGTVSPSSGWYNSGSSVTISATPNIGYWFNSWSGSGSGSSSCTTSTCSRSFRTFSAAVTMNGPITETAKWNRVRF